MASVKKFLEERLSLRVNESKSKVDRPWNCKILGFSMYHAKDGVRIRIAPKSIQRSACDLLGGPRARRPS
jgi:hypothetical protein